MKKNEIYTTATENQLESIIDLHDHMKNSYFWSAPGNAASRRSYERKNSLTTDFELDGQAVRVEQDTICSCKNIYYKMRIFIDSKDSAKDIRFIKSLLKKLTSQAA